MSYSRWGSRGSGYWYTFWLSPDGYPENRDTAVFEVCTVAHFTANELRGDMDECMERAHRMDPDGDIDELRVYAREFLADVDARYPRDAEECTATVE